MTPSELVVYVDVDDTLIRSFGSKRIPVPAMVRHVRDLHRSGVQLYCWSSGGARYAEESARELGLHECFVGYLPKPNLVIDDVPLERWHDFRCLHPNEAVSRTAEDHAGSLGKP